MRSTSGSMSRSMSLSRTVSSDRSMSIDEEPDKNFQEKSKFDASIREHNYKPIHKEPPRRFTRNQTRSPSRTTSFSSDSYDKYKNYKNFKKSRLRSESRSRSHSRVRKRSYSYSTSSSYKSRSPSDYSSSRSRSPRRFRTRPEPRRAPERKAVKEPAKERDLKPRLTERRNLFRRFRERPRLEDKFRFEEQPKLNGRNRFMEKINGFKRALFRDSREEFKIDRKYNTPFLLKILTPSTTGEPEQSSSHEELHVYAWLDSTLRDLVNLIKDISPPTRKQNNIWSFTMDKGEYSIELGNVHSYKINSREDNRTLDSLRFEIGRSINLSFKN